MHTGLHVNEPWWLIGQNVYMPARTEAMDPCPLWKKPPIKTMPSEMQKPNPF